MKASATLTTDDGRSLEVLNRLVQERQKALKEDCSKAVIATAINILVSLRADTRKAPLKGRKSMYRLELTNYVASWERVGGKTHRVVRNCRRGSVNREVTAHCRNVAGQRYIRGENVKVYKATLLNQNMKRREYYTFAKNEKQARQYIEQIILTWLLKKESGMARYALSVAAAKISNRPMAAVAPGSKKAMEIAHVAGVVQIDKRGWNSGNVSFRFVDNLRYSAAALKHGENSISLAMKKAANKTAGLITKAYQNQGLDKKIATPFPEVKKKR